MTAWVVRGGSQGELEGIFISEGIAAIGFGLRQSAAGFDGQESLLEYMRVVLGRPRATGQLWRFAREIRIGDMIVLPRKSPRVVVVGRVSGEYQYRDDWDAPHVRRVDWIAHEIPRSYFDQDLLGYFSRRVTIYRVPYDGDAESCIEKIVTQHLAGSIISDEPGNMPPDTESAATAPTTGCW